MGQTAFKGKIYGSPSMARNSVYDNSASGLSATNTQGAIDELSAEKTDNTNLGTVELTTTASAAHTVGTYFILGGQLVKTTAAIAVGDTISIGTNVEETTISAILSELNSNLSLINNIGKFALIQVRCIGYNYTANQLASPTATYINPFDSKPSLIVPLGQSLTNLYCTILSIPQTTLTTDTFECRVMPFESISNFSLLFLAIAFE